MQWQAWLRNTRKEPPTLAEIQRDEARKLLTVTRAKALDQAWQDRKAELALEQAQGRQAILGLASAASKAGSAEETATSTASSSGEEDPAKSAARKQIEEREAARKGKLVRRLAVGHGYVQWWFSVLHADLSFIAMLPYSSRIQASGATGRLVRTTSMVSSGNPSSLKAKKNQENHPCNKCHVQYHSSPGTLFCPNRSLISLHSLLKNT